MSSETRKFKTSVEEIPNVFHERSSVRYQISVENDEDDHDAHRSKSIVIEAMKRKNDELFVGHIWEGCLVLADFIVENLHLFHNCMVLELGAGCALPSMVMSRCSQNRVICTDYPDPNLIQHIHSLIQQNLCSNIEVEPFGWGESCDRLLSYTNNAEGYDVIFCAELLWKDTLPLMRKLFTSIKSCLKPNIGRAYFSFAERFCEGFSKDSVIEMLNIAREEFGFQINLLSSNDKYTDAIENIPSVVYLYEFVFVCK